jgi:hypothetical protein
MGTPMPDDPENLTVRADHCRDQAVAAMKMAETAHSTSTREEFLKIASGWLQLAEEIERGGLGTAFAG